jgi:hypothetical protein
VSVRPDLKSLADVIADYLSIFDLSVRILTVLPHNFKLRYSISHYENSRKKWGTPPPMRGAISPVVAKRESALRARTIALRQRYEYAHVPGSAARDSGSGFIILLPLCSYMLLA